MQTLQSKHASEIWSYFADICAIPHPSKHDEKLRQWIINWAQEKNIECVKDEVGNLILKKPASAGFENKSAIILQAHLDMVPQKNSNTEHDFLVDPIQTHIDGEWLHANDTTLGADNGIGMASCLAVLADNTLQHGPLEVLLTTDEETGMVGAFGLKSGALQGSILINTDSEQEGELYVGCAGGINVNVNMHYEKMEVEPTDSAYEITLTGLKGGHSGCDINLGRANAVKVLVSVLNNLAAIPFHLSTLQGGSLRNAIPREASTIIVCDKQYQNSLETLIATLNQQLVSEFKNAEDTLSLQIKSTLLPTSILTNSSQKNLLDCLFSCPNGIVSMDDNFSNVVQSSSNLGVLEQNKTNLRFELQVLVRSQVEDEKQKIAEQISQHFQAHLGKVRKDGNYPGWKPNVESKIYKIMEAQYIKLFDNKPKTMVIHAGLECGLFSEKYPHLDMISFGPTIKFPHSPDEKVHIDSVDKYWKLLIATLKSID
ncbi:aminoacyl-histidine dipeptidase [Psychromonas sp. CNPT3]|uniref:aminoacyl-histidine dipeptidase n=1 Tax=Psychromonas sp. CNPT3 TaxID=314282 RepID=UPI000303AB85|nr:aminoacyl-histidine dipeptidase [Psychromonas sp. CNPT3]